MTVSPLTRYDIVVHFFVRIEGLTGAAQYNGKWGKILEVDREACRYQLQLDAGKQLKVKWENVRV